MYGLKQVCVGRADLGLPGWWCLCRWLTSLLPWQDCPVPKTAASSEGPWCSWQGGKRTAFSYGTKRVNIRIKAGKACFIPSWGETWLRIFKSEIQSGTLVKRVDGWLVLAERTGSTYFSLLTDGAFFQVGWSWSELNTWPFFTAKPRRQYMETAFCCDGRESKVTLTIVFPTLEWKGSGRATTKTDDWSVWSLKSWTKVPLPCEF